MGSDQSICSNDTPYSKQSVTKAPLSKPNETASDPPMNQNEEQDESV